MEKKNERRKKKRKIAQIRQCRLRKRSSTSGRLTAAAHRHRLFVKQFKQNDFIVGEDKIVTLKGKER